MMHRYYIFCLTLVTLLTVSLRHAHAESPDDILIIANKGVSVNSITIPELKAIFLKQKANWKGGGRVVALNAKENTPLRAAFQKTLLGMSLAKEKSYWQDQKIRTGLSAPPEFGTLLKAVFSLRGSVSYILRKDYREGVVKILLVLPQAK
ncbi:MAG: hypothetical protein GY847_19215 [Proteobacteria bacterium]|nr:hypothetical protein [Pseudomonadota bacterium]